MYASRCKKFPGKNADINVHFLGMTLDSEVEIWTLWNQGKIQGGGGWSGVVTPHPLLLWSTVSSPKGETPRAAGDRAQAEKGAAQHCPSWVQYPAQPLPTAWALRSSGETPGIRQGRGTRRGTAHMLLLLDESRILCSLSTQWEPSGWQGNTGWQAGSGYGKGRPTHCYYCPHLSLAPKASTHHDWSRVKAAVTMGWPSLLNCVHCPFPYAGAPVIFHSHPLPTHPPYLRGVIPHPSLLNPFILLSVI